MPYQTKMQIISNDLTRRLSNIQEGVIEQQEIEDVIERFIKEMKSSGYNILQAKEAVCSGIRCWKAKSRKRKRKGQSFYRLAQETAQERARKVLTEKEKWYKEPKDISDDEESPRKFRKVETSHGRRRFPGKRKGKQETSTGNVAVKSVLFVPHTHNSDLARKLKESEEGIQGITGNRIKIVERAGVKIQDMLTGNNPWKGMDCQRAVSYTHLTLPTILLV